MVLLTKIAEFMRHNGAPNLYRTLHISMITFIIVFRLQKTKEGNRAFCNLLLDAGFMNEGSWAWGLGVCMSLNIPYPRTDESSKLYSRDVEA